MNLVQRRYNPERVTELATESQSSGGRSNELLLELIAGLPDNEAMEAVSERPRYWSDAMMNQLMDTFEEEAPRSGAVETGTGTAGGDAGLAPSPELGTTGGGLATETAGATTEGEATMDLETDGGGGGVDTDDRPALDTLTGTRRRDCVDGLGCIEWGGFNRRAVVEVAPRRGEVTRTMWPRRMPGPRSSRSGRAAPRRCSTRPPTFTSTRRIGTGKTCRGSGKVRGPHRPGRGCRSDHLVTWGQHPRGGNGAGDTFTVTATVQDPQGNSATGHLDLEVGDSDEDPGSLLRQ